MSLLVPQCADLGQEETKDNEDQWADNVAEMSFGHLVDVRAEQDDHLPEQEE